MRILFVLTVALLAAPALGADHIACVSLDGAQTINLSVEFNDGRYEGTIEKVEIPTPDSLWTTETADGEAGLLLALPFVDFDTISVALEDPRNVHIVADLQISRSVSPKEPGDPENDEYWTAVGGTLSLAGYGAWVVTCEGWQ